MSTLKNSMDVSQWPALSRLLKQLSEYRTRLLKAAVVSGAVEALCSQLILLVILGWFSARHSYQVLWLQMMLASYAVYFWPLLQGFRARRKKDFQIENLAVQLDRFNPGSPDVFRTLLSLENHGPETLVALNRNFASWENTLRIPETPLVGQTRLRWLYGSLALALVLPAFSGHYRDMLYRMSLPLSVWNHIPTPKLNPIDIPQRAALGDTLRLAVQVEKLPASEPVYAHIRFHGEEQRYLLDRSGDTALFRFGPVQGDFDVSFSALSVETAERSVHAVPPPYLRSFAVVVKHPVYTRLPTDSFAEMPATFTVLPGSRITWHATSSQQLKELQAVFHSSDPKTMSDTLNLGGGNAFTFRGSMRKPMELRLRLVTDEDHLIGTAGPYHLEPGVDAPPEIAFLSPSADGELGRALEVPIVFRAHDDYGVSHVTLHYAVTGGVEGASSKGVKDVTAWLQGGTEMGTGVWELKDLPLQPGNVVEVFLAATDNDGVSGPKSAHTETIRLRMPSLEEVLAKVDATERGAITSLKSAMERQDRMPRQAQQASETQPDVPPPLGEWEVRRILNSAPQDHLQRLEKHLDAEAAKAGHDSPLSKQLESLRRETKEMEKHLPPADAWQKPIPEQKKWLDTLMRNQQKLDQKLSEMKALSPPKDAKPPEQAQTAQLSQERKSLSDELQRNLKEQKDLQVYLKDQEQTQNARREDLQQAAQAQQRTSEDVKQALSQIQKTLEKGMENGVLSPDLLQKMERIQELLKEAVPDSTLNRLREAAQNQQVGMEDLQKNLKELMDRQKDMRQGLDRAIKMLEMLRDMHALEALSKDVRELQDKQEQLTEKIGDKTDASSDEDLKNKQEALRQQLENDTKELNRLAREQKAFQELKNQPHAQEAQEEMRETEKDLAGNSSEKSQDGKNSSEDGKKSSRQSAKKKAKSAADELRKMADNMDGMMGQMNGGPDPAEISALLDETLEFSRWLDLIRDKNDRVREGWDEDDATLNQRAAQLARWLRNRMEKLAAEKPYENEVLRHEAAELGFQADALLTVNSAPAAESLLLHARKAARELLKWLQQSNDQDGGGEGSMSGMGSSGSGKKSGGKGKGKGQGQGDDEGLDGMAGRLKGVSGKQMAVNQATYQLLRQMLENRRPGGQSGQGSPNGSMPMPGGGSSSGSNGMPGGTSGNMPGGSQPGSQSGSQNGSPSGSQSGSPPGSQEGQGNSPGGNSSGNSPGGVANSQQGVGESLERMAESANDAGGAARKLRQLAEEARELEKGLREGRIDPEELRKKQERFQTRLLEAANAMEERGQDRKRQAEAFRGGPLKPDSNGTVVREDVFRELQRRREWARSLSLPPEQKRRIESYYEALLAH